MNDNDIVTQENDILLSRLRVLDGTTLKLIALITMIIDHIGAAVLYFILVYGGLDDDLWNRLRTIYYVLRGIGRTSFPIYCFLIVEGFFYTHNVAKYIIRMLIFSIVSEIPFDLAFFTNESVCELNIIRALIIDSSTLLAHQNVFFTHVVGLITIQCIEMIFIRFRKNQDIMLLLVLAITALGALAAHVLNTDYGEYGVLLIVILYILHRRPVIRNAAGYTFFSIALHSEVWAFPGFILCLMYNGERGRTGRWMQYFFYAIYPVHLIILYYIRCLWFVL